MKRILTFVLIAVIVVFSGAAFGATTTTTLDVSANVIPTCTVSASPVNFGDFDSSADIYANGDVTVNCASGVPYHIALGAGQNQDPSSLGRRITDGSGNYILYFLLKPDMYYQWGDSDYDNTYPHGSSVAGTGSGSTQPYTVYGSILQSSALGKPSGLYTDVVTVTVHY